MNENKVQISADSTCDLSSELLEKYNIDVFALPVNLGDDARLDGFNVQPDDLFEYYKKTGKLPTTAAPSSVECTEFYRPYVEKNIPIVHFSISSASTITHQNHILGSTDFPNIYPVDSLSMSAGMGRLAIEASKLSNLGCDAPTIKEKVEAMRPYVEVSFVLDTLEFMWKGGRCSGVTALGANLLKLKPCIEVKDGVMQVCKKYRGSMNSVHNAFLTDRLANRDDLDLSSIFIIQCKLDDKTIKNAVEKIKSLQPFAEVCVLNTGCSVATHCGPGTFGIAYMRKFDK